jgi:hypothetical protein
VLDEICLLFRSWAMNPVLTNAVRRYIVNVQAQVWSVLCMETRTVDWTDGELRDRPV